MVRKDTVEHLAASRTEKINNGDVGTGTVEIVTAAICGHGGVNDFGEKTEKREIVLGLSDEDLDTVVRGAVEKVRV